MAKDLFHQAVKTALIKDNWKITDDPLTLRIDRIKLEIDLAAEKVFAAEKNGRKIAVEVKSFINPSTIHDFHGALGQFLNYRAALQLTEPNRSLFLAVPIDIFTSFFQERLIQVIIQQYSLNILAYDPTKEEIVLWKK